MSGKVQKRLRKFAKTQGVDPRDGGSLRAVKREYQSMNQAQRKTLNSQMEEHNRNYGK